MFTLINNSKSLTVGLFKTAADAQVFAHMALPELGLQPIEHLMSADDKLSVDVAQLWTWEPGMPEPAMRNPLSSSKIN